MGTLIDLLRLRFRAGQSGLSPAARALYQAAVDQARHPVFYLDYGVPDSLDGRFEMITLHVGSLLRRLEGEGPAGRALGQSLFEHMFADMDRGLRELGVGDLGVGRRVKTMARAFYGRQQAYDRALTASDRAELVEALRRNLYGTVEIAPASLAPAQVATYMRAVARALDAQTGDALAAGQVRFPPPPQGVARS